MTSASTLSTATYFQAMLARWRSCDESSSHIVTPQQPKKKIKLKKEKEKEEGDVFSGAEDDTLFVDCDPDIFEDVLYFMRRRRIKPSTAIDLSRLEQLSIEADFFSYDALSEACHKKIQEQQISRTARYGCSIIERNDDYDDAYIEVEEGEVLYLMSAILVGECRMKRSQGRDNEDSGHGVYLQTLEANDTGDFQLLFNIYNEKEESFFSDDGEYAPRCIAHVGLDHSRPTHSVNIDFRCHLDMCVAPPNGSKGRVMLTSVGSGTWNIHWWVGRPEDIPNLGKSISRKDH